MAEAFTVDELCCGPLGQHGAFFRRRYDHQGRAACRRIWALRLAPCPEHLHYGVTVDDALADGGIRCTREHGNIHGRIYFSSCCRLALSEVIWIAEQPGPVFLDRIGRYSDLHEVADNRQSGRASCERTGFLGDLGHLELGAKLGV